MRLDQCHDIHDLRELARRRLPRGIFDFVDRGNGDDSALSRNKAEIESIRLVPRALRDVSSRSTRTSLLGRDAAMPCIVAPTGSAGLMSYQGELAMARAAAKAGIPFVLATGSMTAMEAIASVDGLDRWFQCYMWRDAELTFELMDRAKHSGFRVLVLTVDNPVQSVRAHNLRNGFSLPYRPNLRSYMDMLSRPGWLMGVMLRYILNGGMPRYVNYPQQFQTKLTRIGQSSPMLSDSLNWDDLSRLRDRWRGPILLKGISHPNDALLATTKGMDGVVLSNHGGRNLDSAVAPIRMLPSVRAAVGKDYTVLIDSGFQTGGDVAKALVSGANGVLFGKSPLYGLAAGGRKGAEKFLTFLQHELDLTLAYLGVSKIPELSDTLALPQLGNTGAEDGRNA